MWSTSRRLIGRVRPGASRRTRTPKFAPWRRQCAACSRGTCRPGYGQAAAAVPLQASLVENVRTMLWLLMGAVGMVLLIACVNVSHLLVARSLARRRELAIRASLGAARGRILRHVLTEGVLLVGSAWPSDCRLDTRASGMLSAALPAEMPRPVVEALTSANVGVRVAAASSSPPCSSGLLPALRASRVDLAPQMAEGQRSGRSRGSRWTSNVLIGAQMALAVVLVITATLLVSSLRNLSAVSPGFAADHVVSSRISPPQFRFKDAASRQRALLDSILDRASAIPGVTSVARDRPLALCGGGVRQRVRDRRTPASSDDGRVADGGCVRNRERRLLRHARCPGHGRTFVYAGRQRDIPEGRHRQRNPRAPLLAAESALGRRFTFPGDVAGMRTDCRRRRGRQMGARHRRGKGIACTSRSHRGIPGPMRLIARTTADAAATFEHMRSTVPCRGS